MHIFHLHFVFIKANTIKAPCFRDHDFPVSCDAKMQILEIYSEVYSSCILYNTLIPGKFYFCWFVNLTYYFLLRRYFIHRRGKQYPLMLCYHGNGPLPMTYFIVTMLMKFWHDLYAFSFSSLKDWPLFPKGQNLDQCRAVIFCHF